ncbi:MAG: PAS domain-containing sensor histidine kinase [Ignavibacterium sp.]|nr:MAG: PAS domain-containing sensor histidine kinase [Ignavibacterium sp.]
MSEVKSAFNLVASAELYPTSLFVLNQDGMVLYANDAGLDLIRLSKEDVTDKFFSEFIDENDKFDFQEFLKKALFSTETQITELDIVGAGNKYFHALLTAKPITSPASAEKSCSISVVDLTFLKMKEEINKQSEIRFEKMANTAPVMIWIADVEGLFSFVNRIWLDYTGKKIGEQLGMNWLKNVHPDDFESLLNVYQDAFKAREAFSAEFRFMGANETYQWMLIKGTPRLSDEGIFTGFIGSCVNINEQIESEEKIKKINAELTDSNETKDKFFSIIAHDLRGPLSGLAQILEILVIDYDEMEEAEKIEIVTEAAKASNSTYALIENLLEWSRIQAGRISYEPKLINVYTLANVIENLYNQNIKNKGIDLNVSVDPEINVFADKDMTETVLRNLISNAIKFTPQSGSVSVTSESNEKYCTIKVQDSGIGMDQKTMDKLFRIDVSHTSVGTANEPGTGLGLILCKELVEKQEGKIWVESKVNEGSSFYFMLPIKQPEIK